MSLGQENGNTHFCFQKQSNKLSLAAAEHLMFTWYVPKARNSQDMEQDKNQKQTPVLEKKKKKSKCWLYSTAVYTEFKI